MANTDLDLEPDWAADDDWIDDMTSLPPRKTGVDHVIKIGSQGRAKHPARILVAVDPPQNLDRTTGWWATVAVHDLTRRLRPGSPGLPPRVVKQVEAFISANRQPLLDHWAAEIDTVRFLELMRKI
jgi:hypothetical protein